MQVSPSSVDEIEMLILLSIGGMGMFLLVIVLAFLAAKLATKNSREEDMEGIMEAKEDEFNVHFDRFHNERAIFVIDESSRSNTSDIVNENILSETTDQSGESWRNAANMEEKKFKNWKINEHIPNFEIFK